MSGKMILLFSHTLNKEQIKDAQEHLGVGSFLYLPKNLQDIWSEIPIELDSLEEYLSPIKIFLNENSVEDDVVLIQGDFGASYQMVNFVQELNLLAVYAKTSREIEEKVEANQTIKKSIFKHRGFRKYE